MERKVRGFGPVKGTMLITDAEIILKEGSMCAPTIKKNLPSLQVSANIVNNILIENIVCTSPSAASDIVAGRNTNGWIEWKNEYGQPIDIYRKIIDQ